MGIALSQSEIDDFMRNSVTCILCINRKGKSPLPLPMWFGWENNTIFINTAAASKKAAPLRQDPKVAVLVEAGHQYYALKTVLCMGEARINENQDEVNFEAWSNWLHANKPIYKQTYADKLPPHLQRFYQQQRMTLEIKPHSITTWDFSKIKV